MGVTLLRYTGKTVLTLREVCCLKVIVIVFRIVYNLFVSDINAIINDNKGLREQVDALKTQIVFLDRDHKTEGKYLTVFAFIYARKFRF